MSNKNKIHFENGVSDGSRKPEAVGLETFQKILERDFFAESSIETIYVEEHDRFDLIIDLNCNFSLTESLFHLNNGNWGSFKKGEGKHNKKSVCQFQEYFEYLIEINYTKFDLKELSIHLSDTSIVVERLYCMSIVEQLATIMDSICSNFVHITLGLTEMPYEIFVPVFEEKSSNGMLPTHCESNRGPEDYFKYWGLYFDSSSKMMVYDYGSKKVISGDFHLIA
ncbi:hypothetical protein [Croceivirga thetidis]|uniref:Uncharacterized protein n=1 Tax=Croceivirga thetidis TaxID=2721623 RepID=A0ABX1GRF7_9FLAO|nr:hypothetical protein [Croceivirga thetidis]NKI32533.1 hypothetical protein [Croceivirga thetidis]